MNSPAMLHQFGKSVKLFAAEVTFLSLFFMTLQMVGQASLRYGLVLAFLTKIYGTILYRYVFCGHMPPQCAWIPELGYPNIISQLEHLCVFLFS